MSEPIPGGEISNGEIYRALLEVKTEQREIREEMKADRNDLRARLDVIEGRHAGHMTEIAVKHTELRGHIRGLERQAVSDREYVQAQVQRLEREKNEEVDRLDGRISSIYSNAGWLAGGVGSAIVAIGGFFAWLLDFLHIGASHGR